MQSLSWNELPIEEQPLIGRPLSLTWCFTSGQAFRWRLEEDGWWTGVVGRSVLKVRTSEDVLQYRAYPDLPYEGFWESYLRLDFDLPAMYSDFQDMGPYVSDSFQRWRGLRVLRQDPLETILTFVCTAANSIGRITRAIAGLARNWGSVIADIDGVEYRSFPPLDAFTEEHIPVMEADCNLGYRARNLVGVAQAIANRPTGWADSLRAMSYEQARAELVAIRGIGFKIADCVALFALGKDQAVPVDTHVRQIARDLYFPDLTSKSLTPAQYERVAEHFRLLFGDRAGWVQQYLFLSHLQRRRV